MRAADRFFRNRILARLGDLSDDRLVIREDGEVWSFGGFAGPRSLKARVTVCDSRFWRMLGTRGSLGAAEAYLRGFWVADDLTRVLRIVARNRRLLRGLEGFGAKLATPLRLLGHGLRRNTRAGSRRNIRDHYDLGNELFALFLDETMTYSSGIFSRPGATLREAQVEKLDRVCRRIELSPEDHVLEIGSGWGSFAIHAARQYGARVTTTTISRDQYDVAVRRVREAGLSDRVTVIPRDYRDLTGRYDKVVSIEMIEAVGHEYYDTFFRKIGELTKEDGLVLIQAIVMPDREYGRYRRSVDFVRRYVFPGGGLPSVGAMNAAVARATDLRVIGLEEFGPHYATTLRMWRERFLSRLPEVLDLGYPERFVRLWEYYLCYCEAGFIERAIGSVHLVLAGPRCFSEPPLARVGRAVLTGEGVIA